MLTRALGRKRQRADPAKLQNQYDSAEAVPWVKPPEKEEFWSFSSRELETLEGVPPSLHGLRHPPLHSLPDEETLCTQLLNEGTFRFVCL